MGERFRLTVLAGRYAVCRLDAESSMPTWAEGEVVSVTRTADELSVVCEAAHVPEAVTQESGWRCLRVAGPLDLGMTGVLAALAAPLAAAGVPMFAVSTYDTDYLLVVEGRLDDAAAALRGAGHIIEGV